MSENNNDSVFMLPSRLRKKEILEKMVEAFQKHVVDDLKTSVIHKHLVRAIGGCLSTHHDHSGEHNHEVLSLLPQ